MNLFRKKNRAVGRGKEQARAFHKEFDVLNYTPIDYKYLASYVQFKETAEQKFRKVIEKMTIDDLCDTMFDCLIDAKGQEMKAFAGDQYTYHMYNIKIDKGVADGEIIKAKLHLADLQKDLEELEEKREKYNQLKKEKGIY